MREIDIENFSRVNMLTSRLFLVRALLLFYFCARLLKYTNCRDLNLTAKEDNEQHILFKHYNKPAVQEIKTVYGDTYNCVDFYKQPAFDHPLLKNHSYRPQINQEHTKASQESPLFKGLWANGEGCPTGTIPIRKYTKEQFISTYNLFQMLYPSDDPLPGRFRSSVHTQNGPHTFYGGSALINIYNYPVDQSQYSAGYFLLRAADDQLQFGWMINPALYGDGKSRLFLTTTVGHKKCFNLVCGGFVHTNKDLPIDIAAPETTVRGAESSVEMKPKIIKEGNVWKVYGADDVPLGYWPNEVLNGLKGPAEYLEWGGEVYNPNGLKGPGMGSGFFPTGDPKNDGYARQLTKYDQSGKGSDVGAEETESYADDSNVYKIQDGGFVGDIFGHIMYYGGPGKS